SRRTSRQGCLDASCRQEYLDAIATGLTLEALSEPIDQAVNATPLDRLGAAAATADELRSLSDSLLDRYVQAARADGRSWTEIGGARRGPPPAARAPRRRPPPPRPAAPQQPPPPGRAP